MPQELQRVGDLEIEQDLRMQRWQWRFQRAGWVAIVLIIAAAGLGLCGRGGPFDTGGAGGDPITLEYSRFARRDAPFHLAVTLQPAAAGQEGLEVWLDERYLRRVRVEDVSPGPVAVVDREGWTVYRFDSTEAPQGSLVVEFTLVALGAGFLTGEVRTTTTGPVEFRQFVYP